VLPPKLKTSASPHPYSAQRHTLLSKTGVDIRLKAFLPKGKVLEE